MASAQQLIQQASADAAMHLPGATGNEAERARIRFEIGCLRDAVRSAVAAQHSPDPKGANVCEVFVTFNGVPMAVHLYYLRDRFDGYEETHVEKVFIGPVDVTELFGDESEIEDLAVEALRAAINNARNEASADQAEEVTA